MTSYTSPNNIPYPDDYGAAADVPSDMHSMASAIQTALNTKAPIASPGFTGSPTAPTQAVGTNNTRIATTAFVNSEIANDAPTKTGGGASGTWPINITGSAASATNADKVDGKHFNWSDQGDYKSYIWGGSDGVNMYVMPTWKFAKHDHTHNPSASGISVVYHNFGDLAAGQEKSQSFARSDDQYPVVSVSHPSSYIVAVVSSLYSGGYTIEVRNGTQSTNHSGVGVIVHLVRAA